MGLFCVCESVNLDPLVAVGDYVDASNFCSFCGFIYVQYVSEHLILGFSDGNA